MTSSVPRIDQLAQSHHIAQNNNYNSPLLRLPAELRNIIFSLVCDSVTVSFRQDRYDSVKQGGITLLLTCRQTLAEVVPIVNSFRTLVVDGKIRLDYLAGLVGRSKCADLLTIELNNFVLDKIMVGMVGMTVNRYSLSVSEAWNDWSNAHTVQALFPRIGRVVIPPRPSDGGAPSYKRSSKDGLQKLLREYFDSSNLEVVFR